MARGATNQKGPQRAFLNAVDAIRRSTGTLPVNLFVVAEGDVVVMRITNNSGQSHPMHLHGHHLVVLARNEAVNNFYTMLFTEAVAPEHFASRIGEYLAAIGQTEPLAVRSMKRQLNHIAEGRFDELTMRAANRASMTSPQLRERLTRQLAGRKAR